MTHLFVSNSVRSVPLKSWTFAWKQTSTAQWHLFVDQARLLAEDCRLDVLDAQDCLGIGTDGAEPSLVLRLEGRRSSMRQMAHLLAIRHRQYAVRLVHEDGPHLAISAPLESIARGVGLLSGLKISGSALQNSLEISFSDLKQADRVASQLAQATVRPVLIERVSGERQPWWRGHQIVLRPL